MRLGVFGAGGFARQIIDLLPPDTVFFTDSGEGDLLGFPVFPLDRAAGCELLIAVADPSVRRRVAAQWRANFATLIAPSAEVSRFASIGKGSVICRQAVIEADVTIGRHFHANLAVIVGHETEIGDFVTVAPLAGVGSRCTIGHGVTIGMGALIRPDVRIGDNAMICMGAVVTRDVTPNAKVAGHPARPVARR